MKILVLKGGEGSGFHGHRGVIGVQGGSAPDDAPVQYPVKIPLTAKEIDFSGPVSYYPFDHEDNKDKPVYNLDERPALKRITRASKNDLEVMKQIAKDEKIFYDNPHTLGPDEHEEVRLLKYSWGYGIYYTVFYLDKGKVIETLDWVNDFSRCPTCREPTLSPVGSGWDSCQVCSQQFSWEGDI